MFSLSLSPRPFMGDRLFIGDWLFLGDTRGWSWRAASGVRADSMVETEAAAATAGGAAAAAAGRAAGSERSRAGPLYPLRSWRQNGGLATHSPRHAHLRPPPRSHWLVPRAGPRLPLWRRRREREPRPSVWRQRRADKAGERRSRPAPAQSAGLRPPCLRDSRLPRETLNCFGVHSGNAPWPCFRLFFSGPSYLPIHFHFQH